MSEVAEGQEELLPEDPAGDEGVEIVLEGEEEPTSQSGLPKGIRRRINKLNQRVEKRDHEIDRLKAENELLKMQRSPDVLRRPKLEDFDFDESKFNAAMDEYEDRRSKQMQESVISEIRKTLPKDKEDVSGLEAHYDRAEKLGASDYEAAEDAVIDALGKDMFKQVVQALNRSEKVVYFLGKNPGKLSEIAELIHENPVQATLMLGELQGQLRLQPKKKPAPESEIESDGAAGAGDWASRIDRMRERVTKGEKTMEDLMALKKKARAEGAKV